jgi:hypothetical protein
MESKLRGCIGLTTYRTTATYYYRISILYQICAPETTEKFKSLNQYILSVKQTVFHYLLC